MHLHSILWDCISCIVHSCMCVFWGWLKSGRVTFFTFWLTWCLSRATTFTLLFLHCCLYFSEQNEVFYFCNGRSNWKCFHLWAEENIYFWTLHKYTQNCPWLSNYVNVFICSKLLTLVNDDYEIGAFFPLCLFSIILFTLIINHLVGSVLIEKLRMNFCYYYYMIFIPRKWTRIMQIVVFIKVQI